jgi:hypothetical protein
MMMPSSWRALGGTLGFELFVDDVAESGDGGFRSGEKRFRSTITGLEKDGAARPKTHAPNRAVPTARHIFDSFISSPSS